MNKIIDLTRSYSAAVAGFASLPAKDLQQDGWNARQLQIYSHAGTHVDAPIHFGAGNQTIDELPLERLMGKAWIISIPITQSQQLITENDFDGIAGKIQPGDSVVLKTGWHRYLLEDKFRKALPRVSESLAHWLVEKQINMLVVEPPSVADVNNLAEVTLIHQILFQGNVIIIEGIVNTEQLTTDFVTLIALPLKIENGDGAPARVIAIQNNEHVHSSN